MGINSGLFIYIFRQFFRGLPKELEESAEIDGANTVTTFVRIMLPNARGALITVGLFSFVWQWNDTFFTKLFQINSPDFPILTQRLLNTVDNIRGLSNSVLTTMISQTVADNPELLTVLTSTAALLVMLPILIIYIFVQKHFVEGIERTGIVG